MAVFTLERKKSSLLVTKKGAEAEKRHQIKRKGLISNHYFYLK